MPITEHDTDSDASTPEVPEATPVNKRATPKATSHEHRGHSKYQNQKRALKAPASKEEYQKRSARVYRL